MSDSTNLRPRLEEIETALRKYYRLIETAAITIADVSPRLKELNEEKGTLLKEQDNLTCAPKADSFAPPSERVVAACVKDLHDTLRQGSIMQRKAFLRSFVKRIDIRDSSAEIEYTCPIGLTGNRRNEVLSTGENGSRGRARTYNHTVNSRVLYH